MKIFRTTALWKPGENDKIDFSFLDAHDLYGSRDTSKPETIKTNLRERMKNAKQVVLLGSREAKNKGSDGKSFLAHEIRVLLDLNLPVVVVNLDGDRNVDRNFIPSPLLDDDYYTVSISFQPTIIMYALDNYVTAFSESDRKGAHYYEASVYSGLSL